MKDREISQAIALLQSVKDAYKTNEAKIRQEVRRLEETDIEIELGYKSINYVAVEEKIRNSIDWDKVVQLIHKLIPRRNIEKIKNTQNDSKLKQFKELVDFILDKMSRSKKNRVKYLYSLETIQPSTSSRTTTTTSSGSSSSSQATDSADKKDLSYLPWVIGIGIGCGILGAIFGGSGGFVVGAVIGAIVGYLIKNSK